MVGLLIFAVFISSTDTLNAQSSVTFRLSMAELVERNLFLPDSGERVVVRGSFNQWTGESNVLQKVGTGSLYTGTFRIDATIGDTLEYKFVIRKSNGRTYWERRPNPENSNHGNRQLIISQARLILPVERFDYDEYIRYPVVFGKEKSQQDFEQIRETVAKYHPALYDYTEKNALDSLFDSHRALLTTDMEFEDFYTIASSVLSYIGCGHTKLWIPSDYWSVAPRGFFPLKLIFCDEKVFVSGSFTDSVLVPIGSEIISLDGVPIGKIIGTLKSMTSSDGFIEAFRSKSVEKNFAKRYALRYGYHGGFLVGYISSGDSAVSEVNLPPVGVEAIDARPVRGNELSLNLLEGDTTALLTINTFIYYDNVEGFRSFIDSSFGVIKERGVHNLIIDLRGNDGGDPFCSSYLLSYIEHEPVPYFAEPYGRYDRLAKPIPLAENHFNGQIFTLVDGSAFSTTGHFCALLKYHRIGKLVGTETGATYTCTGSVHYVDLANTKLILGTAQKRRYSAAVRDMDRRRGVLPDYVVWQSPGDIVKNRDTVLDFALDLVQSAR